MTAAEVLAELGAVYGLRFMRQYDAMEPGAVVRAWEKQLASLTPLAIEWAMLHLPLQPLNALEFRALALQRPAAKPREEPVVRADPQRVLEVLKPLRTQRSARLSKQWAIELQARELAGERLSPALRVMWRNALGQQ